MMFTMNSIIRPLWNGANFSFLLNVPLEDKYQADCPGKCLRSYYPNAKK